MKRAPGWEKILGMVILLFCQFREFSPPLSLSSFFFPLFSVVLPVQEFFVFIFTSKMLHTSRVFISAVICPHTFASLSLLFFFPYRHLTLWAGFQL